MPGRVPLGSAGQVRDGKAAVGVDAVAGVQFGGEVRMVAQQGAQFDFLARRSTAASAIRPRRINALSVRSRAAPFSVIVSGGGRTLRSERAAAVASRTAWVSESFGMISVPLSEAARDRAASH